MRVIAGEFRGRKLLPPQSLQTRPITDRVKQSLFDIVSPLLRDATIYDCFAGTGSMGIESLSRGARHAKFFESDRSAVKLLRQNISAMNITQRCHVVPADIFKWFASASPKAVNSVDLIFLDPPYRFVREKPEEIHALVRQMATAHLQSDGVIVFRHDAADDLALPGVQEYDRREYGGMVLRFLRGAK